ncbi:hypothetical protein PILCRDRAFT_818667 [Piloderma croceum F 1598]|uniref:Uncharacterized protein n=1 Tax=Piloderma croceum (strain F 1598) TaxID=765440 RepID=A0A0C3FXQ5_PILCF|nr:hypothetical protein PILCRDRAFT_818667 [Piloderma croceum F 1598]
MDDFKVTGHFALPDDRLLKFIPTSLLSSARRIPSMDVLKLLAVAKLAIEHEP